MNLNSIREQRAAKVGEMRALLATAVITGLMLLWFRKRKWL